MQIISLNTSFSAPSLADGCGLCLGHFDGVHLGHRALVEELKQQNGQREIRLPLGAMLFTTPPTATLSAHPTPQLTTLEEKLALLGKAGLDFAVLYDFPAIKNLSPEQFIDDVLLRDCNARIVVCGFNYTFGARGAGTPETLRRVYAADGTRTLSVVPAFTLDGEPVSSSRIRALLEEGDAETATALLGRPYRMSGVVTGGKGLGRTMQIPTANLRFARWALVPAHGVYISQIAVDGMLYPAISNVGVRPTFEEGEEANCETFILDFDGDLYGKEITLEFHYFLRPEQKFDSLEKLKEQIHLDAAETFKLLR